MSRPSPLFESYLRTLRTVNERGMAMCLPGLFLLVSPGTYDVIVRKRGVVLGRGTATTEVPSRVRADLYR